MVKELMDLMGDKFIASVMRGRAGEKRNPQKYFDDITGRELPEDEVIAARKLELDFLINSRSTVKS